MESLEDYLSQTIQKAVKDAVAEAMKDIHKEIRKGVTPEYLTKKKVMEITGWSSRTLQHMRDTNQIDFV